MAGVEFNRNLVNWGKSSVPGKTRRIVGIKIEKVPVRQTAHPFVFFTSWDLAPAIIISLLISVAIFASGNFIAGFIFPIFYLAPLILGQAICYFLFQKTRSIFIRGFILYAFWFVVFYVHTVLFQSTVSWGMAMDYGIYKQEPSFIPMAEFFTLVTIIVVPWILICLWKFRGHHGVRTTD